MRKISFAAAGLLLLFCSALECSTALAQKSDISVSEGISGDIDSKRRDPVLSTSFEIQESLQNTKILADAYMPNGEFVSYPIRFDFYVNRQLFASQIRAIEQPGPVGVDVPFTKATPPFDYSVVATLLHPNRQFTTTFYGRADLQSLIPTPTPTPSGPGTAMKCTLTQTTNAGASNEETKSYDNDSVTISGSAGSFTFQFTGTDSETNTTADVSGAINASESDNTTGSGNVTVAPQGGSETTVDVSGTLAYNNDQALEEISVSSNDDNVSLDCCAPGGACETAALF